jgi:hypothetical protein
MILFNLSLVYSFLLVLFYEHCVMLKHGGVKLNQNVLTCLKYYKKMLYFVTLMDAKIFIVIQVKINRFLI